ncbi:ribulose-phosphate 3-epimerase, cytoplasmic isoform-like [Bidens hawaiensis]|uniref:ribulose-phosphate 3-epimerase, cytoplasmic isoform-like n=1 Tax=Bidens hawaiensis TaxID=980011 RepID=UPI00404AE3E5
MKKHDDESSSSWKKWYQRRSRHRCCRRTSRIWHQKLNACSALVPIGFTWTSCHFVPNLTIGTPVIESLRKHTNAYLDCHLMVTNPLDYVDQFGKAGASGFTFHVEVSKDNWQELVKRIKSKGMRPGVALKPGTPVEEVFPLVEGENPVEMVLVMTVEPGFGGQKFMPDMMNKVRTLREKYPTLDIEVDGG